MFWFTTNLDGTVIGIDGGPADIILKNEALYRFECGENLSHHNTKAN